VYIFKQIGPLQQLIALKRAERKRIGFAPTMGALHRGHMSLIDKSVEESDLTVASIFVNPTQFDNADDLAKYPETFKDDVLMLIDAGCHVLFAPSVDEIYPNGAEVIAPFDFSGISKVLEGSFRPGHFDGMAQVVKRLLEIVKPDKIFMGQKDYQQQLIVRELISKMEADIELVRCPIVREENGLAMSSRNRRLNEIEISSASNISKQLFRMKKQISTVPFEKLISEAKSRMEANGLLKVEYLEIVDALSLQKVHEYSKGQEYLICTAVYCGPVRLIDNVLIS